MIVWGGDDIADVRLNSGARFSPAGNSWSATTTTNAPAARRFHSAVWTGTEMVIWGGADATGDGLFNGGRYNPATNAWATMSTTSAPFPGRNSHMAVWTGTEMIVWGGFDGSGSTYPENGGMYDPASNTWRRMISHGAPEGRTGVVAVWTGREMLIFGGTGGQSGGRYDPVLDSWNPMTSAGAPEGVNGPKGVWTGAKLLLFGGTIQSAYHSDVYIYEPGRTMVLYQRP
jgi:N-acetylneuraminic acid mutarotase